MYPKSGFRVVQIYTLGDVCMNITIIGRKCTPKESFKARAEKKMQKVDRFFGGDAAATVKVTVEKAFQVVEISVKYNGMVFRAEESAADMLDALDICVDQLIRKIRKNKTRVEKKLREGAFDELAAEEAVPEEEYKVERCKQVPLKPLSVDEAILQMNMLGHQFFMFQNAATDEINVIYLRKNGAYGLLEPDIG